MVDIFTPEKRSWVMSRIRSKWTKQEKQVHNYLKGLKIKHKMHPKIEGSPDIVLTNKKLAIFLHGCFWHKYPKHFKAPKSRKDYWIPKIGDNVSRDNKINKELKRFVA